MTCSSNIRSWNELAERIKTLECNVSELELAAAAGGFFTIVSFTTDIGVLEKGLVVSSITFTWTVPEDPDTQSINNGIGVITPNTARNKTVAGLSIITNTSFTLTAIKDTVTAIKSLSISFIGRRYWGTSPDDTLGNNPQTHSFLLSNGFSSELSGSKSQSKIMDCTSGKYFYFMYPQIYGVSTFKVNSFPFTAITQTIQNVTNSVGYSEPYYIYKSNYIQYGSAITVEVI